MCFYVLRTCVHSKSKFLKGFISWGYEREEYGLNFVCHFDFTPLFYKPWDLKNKSFLINQRNSKGMYLYWMKKIIFVQMQHVMLCGTLYATNSSSLNSAETKAHDGISNYGVGTTEPSSEVGLKGL